LVTAATQIPLGFPGVLSVLAAFHAAANTESVFGAKS
jgi:hypothetical protein